MDTDPQVIRLNIQWCDAVMQMDIAETRAQKLVGRHYIAPELARDSHIEAQGAAARVRLALACIAAGGGG